MRGRTNMTGIQESGDGNFPAIPAGSYTMRIERIKDKTTANGDPMVSIGLVVASGQYKGRYVWDNIVIPLANSPAIKILGRTKHFLHCIGEPYEGEIEYDSERWMDRIVQVVVDVELPNKYHNDDKNIVSEYVLEEEGPVIVDTPKGLEETEDIPF